MAEKCYINPEVLRAMLIQIEVFRSATHVLTGRATDVQQTAVPISIVQSSSSF